MAEIPKTYDPQSVEETWYSRWLANDCFKADPNSAKPAYSIVIPPPNVTGVLTLGHVLNNTIQDILARRARMLGKEVLWLPGTDHAGIATQTVVERKLRKEEKLHRRDLGREKFLERVWEWKEKHGGIIIQQLKKLGCSCDWSRERFTMDEAYSKRVQEVFVDLYNKGAIYRGKRMVNWCPVSQTALSDEEVIMKPHKGVLYYFRVEVAEEPGTFLTIATTRPETIPGDTAVAVNPKDERYAHLIGKHIIRPLPVELPPEQKRIPIVGDDHVDFEFGTGVLKVTPAHDKADFEIGVRQKLPVIDVMNPDGTMNELAGEDLAELDRFEARDCAVEKLREIELLVKEEPYENNVGFSERADVPIEPRLSEQWFLKYPQIGRSLRAVCHEDSGDDRIAFRPERWSTVFSHWLENIQDWCISRQLWWGHRIPAWYRQNADGTRETYVGLEQPAESEGWVQDEDVLDTWFSSWLWPFDTMDAETRGKFYPTTDLVTGPDIIFFWVARMIMAGFEYEDRKPFSNVYFTGIIRDKQGRKMSKSLGNSPDPLDLIAKYGADALRFGVMRSAPLGQDVLFDEKNVELGRNFCTKLWNAARFRQLQGGSVEGEINPQLLSSDDKWILLRLDSAIREITTALEEYKFAEAAQALYRFFWSEYCDWYIEASKAVLNGEDAARKANALAVIDFVLAHALRLLHPFVPFITEELWHGLGYHDDLPDAQGGKTILYAHWPQPLDEDFKAHYGLTEAEEQAAADKYSVVMHGRGLRRDFNIPSNKRVRFVLRPSAEIAAHEAETIKLLLNAEALEIAPGYEAPKGTPVALTPMGELHLPLDGLVDVSAERDRLIREIGKVATELDTVRRKLSNSNFVDNAPAAVVEEHRQREAAWLEKLGQLERMRDALAG